MVGTAEIGWWIHLFGTGWDMCNIFTAILIIPHGFVRGDCEIRNPNCKVLPWSFKVHSDKDTMYESQWQSFNDKAADRNTADNNTLCSSALFINLLV